MLPAVTAIALVESTFINTELVNNAATGVAIITVYIPCTGFTPASTPLARPPVTPSIAFVSAALRSLLIPDVLKPRPFVLTSDSVTREPTHRPALALERAPPAPARCTENRDDTSACRLAADYAPPADTADSSSPHTGTSRP